ncbi:Proline-specific permease, partial [Linnemannia elongata]
MEKKEDYNIEANQPLENSEYNLANKHDQLERGLKSRHIQFLALGGAIAEFWFASIKLITICGLIILGIVIFFGGAPNQDGILGFHYWKTGGAFLEYKAAGSLGRFLGYWHAFVSAGFAFITSPELIAIAAGETIDPRRNIPKAARRFVWRLALFYGVSSLLI